MHTYICLENLDITLVQGYKCIEWCSRRCQRYRLTNNFLILFIDLLGVFDRSQNQKVQKRIRASIHFSQSLSECVRPDKTTMDDETTHAFGGIVDDGVCVSDARKVRTPFTGDASP